jgi:hypothetical protein
MHMKDRCYSVKDKEYRNYGGRGIVVCQRWLESFEHFLTDMGQPPRGFSLDRIDNDGNYEPSNCRWASSAAQGRNRRTNVLIEWKGETRCVTEWAELLNVPSRLIFKRLRMGWSFERAIETPAKVQGRT